MHHLVLSATVVVFVLMMNKSSMPSSIVLMASRKPTLIGTVYCTVFSGKTYVVCSCRRLFGNEPPLYEFSKYIHLQGSNHSILNLFMDCLFMVAEINFFDRVFIHIVYSYTIWLSHEQPSHVILDYLSP